MGTRLQGKVAIVTGAGGGIGRGIVEAFGAEGAHIALGGRTLATLEDAARSVEKAGGRALPVVCDVNVREQVDALVAAAVAELGPPDILVNNAQGGGAGHNGRLQDLSDELFLATYRGGVLSTLYGMQAVFPHMQDRGGAIVNMASATGLQGTPGFAAYGSTKEAIRGLTRHAAREWGRFNIRVNVVAPAAASEGTAKFKEEKPEQFAAALRQIPLRYMAEPIAIGRNILGLVTDLDYLTGATLAVDGGLQMLT